MIDTCIHQTIIMSNTAFSTDLSSDYKVIFNLLKYSLFPSNHDDYPIPEKTDWNFIYEEMRSQTVSTLVYPWLRSHTLSNSTFQQKWMTDCLQQQTRWMQIMHAQTQLINLLEEHNIPSVIIKGAAAMMAYPNPSLRAVGDIDFLVKREDYDKVAHILENSGYQLENIKNPKVHHYGYTKNGISFELHKRLAIIKDTDEQLLSLFESGIENRTWHTMGSVKFPVLPKELNALVLLFHINQHIRTGLGLRHIIDWMMYMYSNQNLNDILPIARNTGMEKLAITVTIMCQRYLGLPIIIEESEDYPSDDLMSYIIGKGNFGCKPETEEDKIAHVSFMVNNPIRFLVRLQKGGMKRWNLVQKHRLLRPFAWAYQLVFIIRNLLNQRISPTKFINSYNVGLGQRDMLYKLGLDIDRRIEETHNTTSNYK